MNDPKLKKLLSAARNETPPELAFNFAQRVVNAIRRQTARPSFSLAEQLAALFPRLAAASLLVIALCIAGDLYFSSTDQFASADINQLTEDLLLADNSQ